MKQFLLILSLFIALLSFSQDSHLMSKDTISNPLNVTIENILPKKESDNLGKLIPILTLVYGFFMGKIYEHWQERRQINKDGKIWLEYYAQLLEPIEAQIISIEDFVENFQNNQDGSYKPNFSQSLECEDFDFLNKNSLVSFLTRKHKFTYSKAVKTAGKMKNSITIIRKVSTMLKESLNEFSIESKKLQNYFAEEFQEFRVLNAKYIDAISLSQNPSKCDLKFQKIVAELTFKHVKLNTPIKMSTYLMISNDFFKNYLREYHQNTRNEIIEKAIKHLTICDQTINKIIDLQEQLVLKQNHVKETYQRNAAGIKEIIKELE